MNDFGRPMNMTAFLRLAMTIAVTLSASLVAAAESRAFVNESARQIPIAHTVDVVVVGGSTGAVSAAVAASESGASVFLAAPRPYLGDDMTATLRLWLEEGEHATSGLAETLFHDPVPPLNRPSARRMPFTYSADQPSATLHADTPTPSKLSDFRWGDATRQSVQYDDDVNITVDLGESREVGGVHVWAYNRGGSNGFAVRDVTVFTSNDREKWQQVATAEPAPPEQIGDTIENLAARFDAKTRYLKLAVRKTPKATRILLGEIEVIRPAGEEADEPSTLPPWPRPMHVKRTLDQALLDAGIPFLYNCYATDLLTDAAGRPCGIVMCNRAGRQAVIAKTIIDATERAIVARLAGAKFRPYSAGSQTFRRVVIGGEVQTAAEMTARVIEPAFVGVVRTSDDTGLYPIIEYTLTLPMTGDTNASWFAADHRARTLTYHPGQQFTSDILFQVPPDPMFGERSCDDESLGVDGLPLESFCPKGIDRLFVLGGCADVPRRSAEKLLRPVALIDLGERLGKAAAAKATKLPAPSDARLRGTATREPAAAGDVREFLAGTRPVEASDTIEQDARTLPVLGRYDVVVIGGGTAGAPAGIAAARQGAKTLVVEQLCGLGGVGTTGAISNYCQGNRVGFTESIGDGSSWVIEQRMEWWRRSLLEAGADVWFGTTGCGTFVGGERGNEVRGAVVVTPRGRGVVLADVVIDATGNADVAAAAGAPCVYTDESEFAMQGTGLPPRELGAAYTNTDYTYTDETDLVDVWHLFVYAREKFQDAFDLGQLVDTRERRQIVGDFTITILDQISGRTFPDTITKAYTSYDTHGYIIDPYLLLRHPLRQKFTSYVPYRCLLPRGFEGLIVTGIGLSAHRDAQPIVRMQPDVQNFGYAAGTAAAMASGEGVGVRQIDVRKLQRHLVDVGILDEEVIDHIDSYPLPTERVEAAVDTMLDDYRSLAIILGHGDTAVPLLQQEYRNAEGEKKVAYAKVLAMMGDDTGVDALVAEVKRTDKWDAPPAWNIGSDYPGATQVGWGMTHLDNTLVALGRSGSPKALPVVMDKLTMLGSTNSFSHYRAVCAALEWLGDPRAARPLAELLRRPAMAGYAATSIDDRAESHSTRQQATRELMIARALYRCGDDEGLAQQTLETYSKDLRGHFARHAKAVLEAGKGYRPKR
ncbi:MAG: FAD-dependent oxidoreductase [Planctomycetaceae bacterium]|nr:FAD-dependent oxidoreductase [Planctomycetaceae bacterium]